MVKTRGPLISQAASGTLAKTLTFSTWKGKSYLRLPGKPTNNQQAPQLGMRAAMGFLSKSWESLTAEQRQTWSELVEPATTPAYNAYLAFNLARYADNLAVTQSFPPGTGPYNANIITFAATGFFDHVRIKFRISANPNHWTAEIHRAENFGFEPLTSNAVGVIHPNDMTVDTFFEDHPPSKRVWFYRLHLGNTEGIAGSTSDTFVFNWT